MRPDRTSALRVHPRTVVVTGLGAVSPYGHGKDVLWRGLSEGRAAIGPFGLFDRFEYGPHRTQIAGYVEDDVGPLAERLRGFELARLSRTDRFAVAAAFEALAQAGLEPSTPGADPECAEDLGVFLGSSTGGMFESELYLDLLARGDRRALRLRTLTSQQPSGPADTLAQTLGTYGPKETTASACSAATMAIGSALDALESGELEIALAGGSDGLCQLTYAGFNSLRAVDERPARPFRPDRGGLSLGEGAGILVLETLEHAHGRGATPLAVLAATGDSCDAHHMTAPHPEGRGAVLAIHRALERAGRTPAEVDVIDAHGTGTPLNDEAEWAALSEVFGERARSLPLTSTKGAVGHLLGGCGGLEAVVSALFLETRSVHPTPGSGPVDPACPADLVLEEPRELADPKVALSLNLAFGGATTALLLEHPSVLGEPDAS